MAIEWDAYDETANHLLVLDNQQQAIGCARILECGSIGRMAVITSWRGVGLGTALLDKAIQSCKERNISKITLSAQTHAISFYEKAGFVVCSDVYLDANINHVDMQLNI